MTHIVGLNNLQTKYNRPVHDCPVEIYKLTLIIYRQFAKGRFDFVAKKLAKSMSQKTTTSSRLNSNGRYVITTCSGVVANLSTSRNSPW